LAIPEKGIESGKLYELFAESDRTIRRHLEFLEEIGLVKINQINTQKGRKRNIEITFNKELLK